MLRRRQSSHQQNHTAIEEQDDAPTDSKRRPRRSSALIFFAAVVAAGIFVTCLALRSSSSSAAPPLRGNNGGNGKEQTLTAPTGNRRVIAVGDIHGDMNALVRALTLAKVVTPRDDHCDITWTGGTDIVVQIGDLLNRAEPRDEETLSCIVEIERQARDAGGQVMVTVGDHDLHNAPNLWHKWYPPGEEEEEGPPFPSWITAAHVVDRTLFVHGSLARSIFENVGGGSLQHMIDAAHAWLSQTGEKPLWIGRPDGPIWSRLYSNRESDEDPQHRCEEDLSPLLEELNLGRMVVGHTVRREGISSICDGRVWRIDVGLSSTETRAGKIGASEVLELRDGGTIVNVLSTDVKLASWK
eukprot:CAMPEP_0183715102 /NCGR_PEP_ID=MMETSP0737-20130205/9461_1 /TAXON_ID=385413 /ORGANISM="Thalassiosira miniscula, Strain CCMP1093" /LENGTH=354 /DNA_ID=CAMNT_0025944171 /DNA_START=27 /DNA_END=1091 /DNA_ORIENTATION=+